jgi:hypothetical protein
MEKNRLHYLNLTYPPISNQEGDWLYEVEAVRKALERSKLYFIGQRQELLFRHDASPFESNGTWGFYLECGEERRGPISFDFSQLSLPDHVQVEIGPKCLKIRSLPLDPEAEPLYWCTPDILLHQHFNDIIELGGLVDPKSLVTFQLHYVGISKKGDSFRRLFEGHANRCKILSNEGQIAPQARLTDEITLFMFHIQTFTIETNIGIDDIDQLFENDDNQIEQAVMAADAEKAFIKILQTKYNFEKYNSYPRSQDGLWKSGFDRYGFVINEHLVFATSSCKIHGGKAYTENEPDLILVAGETVSLMSLPRAK